MENLWQCHQGCHTHYLSASTEKGHLDPAVTFSKIMEKMSQDLPITHF